VAVVVAAVVAAGKLDITQSKKSPEKSGLFFGSEHVGGG
jgi:hypothetical protein